MQRIEQLTADRQRLQQVNRDMRETVEAQQRQNLHSGTSLQRERERVENLQDELENLRRQNERNLGRLEQAEKQNEFFARQLERTVEQFTEVGKLRQHVVFATNQLRETQATSRALESRLATFSSLQPANEEDTAAVDMLDVEALPGIETEQAQKLHDSGIHTIGDLARQTPARVAHFVGLSDWDRSAEWIAEARARLAIARSSRPQA
jgi:chromosome segregation ATPase